MTPYNLKSGYTSREVPDYFEDTLLDSTEWQADVYRLAHYLAHHHQISRLVDLGCGRAGKLLQYADQYQLVGIDYGSNIETLIHTHPEHHWMITDLNNDVVRADYFNDSVVICADVIEHLPNPMPLIQTLYNACQTARYVLVSTPDRQRVHRRDHDGPPINQYHCREWTNAELVHWFRSENLPVQWYGWTVSNDNRRDQVWTSLIVLSKSDVILELPYVFEPAPIEWDSLGIKHDTP